MTRKWVTHLLGTVLLCTVLATACQPAQVSQPTTAAPTQEEVTGPAAAPSTLPKTGEVTFTFAHKGPILTMDAPVTWELSTHWLTNLLYDCLIWRNTDDTGYVGQAAEKWERLDDTTWRFHLRPNLTFQNGEPLDAAAVKWNIDRVRTRKDFQVYPQWQFAKEVKVVDNQTIDVLTDGPVADLEYFISYNGCELLPPKYLQQVGEEKFAQQPVGSGPYKLEKFTTNERYEFVAWDGYWAGRPEVDRVVYQVIPESSSEVAALLAGQVDMIYSVPPPEIPKVQADARLKTVTVTSGKLANFRVRNETTSGDLEKTYSGYTPATMDVRIRQAISHALDRKTLAEVQGSAHPRLIRHPAYMKEGQVGQWATEQAAIAYYDPELAKKLIKEAGYDPDNGKKPLIHLDSPANDVGREKEVAEAMKVMLEKVGFQVDLNILDLAAYMEQVYVPGNNRELAQINLGSGPMVPLYYGCGWVEPAYTVCDKDWEALGKQILVEFDHNKRLDLWAKWWDRYVSGAETITLYEVDTVVAMNKKFDWKPRNDGWFTFRDLKLAK